MIGVAGGLAQEGLRPVVHSYAPFLVERPFEQIKLDLGHQDAGAILVSIGASYDASEEGRTHQAPGDVALLATLPGFAIHVPGHADEAEALLRREFARDGRAYLRLSGETNARGAPGRAAHDRAPGAGPARRSCSRSGRRSTRCWPRRPTSRCRSPTLHRAAVPGRGAARCGDRRRRRDRRAVPRRHLGRGHRRGAARPSRTACSRSACRRSSCAATARPPSTAARTGSTPPASADRSTRSWPARCRRRDRPAYLTVQPPSISSVWPVISDAAGDARKTTAPATSIGSPTRCSPRSARARRRGTPDPRAPARCRACR